MNHPLRLSVIALAFACAACQSPAPTREPTGSGSVMTGASLPVPAVVLDENTVPSINEGSLSLAAAINASEVQTFLGMEMTAAQRSYLEKNKFLLVPAEETSIVPSPSSLNFDSMLKAFDDIQGSGLPYLREPQNAKFVTPDLVLHAYHRYFELTLEELEKTDLNRDLRAFTKGMVENALSLYQKGNSEEKERAEWVAAQMIVAQILVENAEEKPEFFPSPEIETAWLETEKTADSYEVAAAKVPTMAASLTAEMRQRILDELELIYAASTVQKSPLFGPYNPDISADYTQYTPRSHYTKSSVLRAYFRAMMYLGRNSYLLKNDIGVRDATIVTSLLQRRSEPSGILPSEQWNRIMEITGFYAGQSDDLTTREWMAYVKETLSADVLSLSDADIEKLSENIADLRLPKILSDVVISEDVLGKTKDDLLRDTLGVRVFGQRFTFDAWVLNQLTAGQEKTEVKLPSTPSALFVNAALGGQKAATYIPRFLKETAKFEDGEEAGLLAKLLSLRASLAALPKEEWFSSLGTAWTYVLGSLTRTFGEGYPQYMRSEPFADKQIQTFLGSYAELKHDTLLYAKQSYAELGAGGPEEQTPPPVPKGFVEPNLVFWNRILQLAAKQNELFTRLDLLKDTNASYRLAEFTKNLSFFGTLAQKELAGTPLTEEEYETLRTTNLSYLASPLDMSVLPDEESGKTELVADIHTDAVEGQILYEATGRPYVMLALVGNEASPRLVIGVAFNHYEFTGPLGGNRMTDEDWKKTVYEAPQDLPAKNFWYDSLVAR